MQIQTQPSPYCFLCGNSGESVFTDLEDVSGIAAGTWTLRTCGDAGCGVVWVDPRPLPGELDKLYRDYFTHQQGPEKRALGQVVKDSVLRARYGYMPPGSERLRCLGGFFSRSSILMESAAGSVAWLRACPGGRLLDVGCGNGAWIAQMRELGWKVIGVEPDEEAAEAARSGMGVDVRHGLLEDCHFSAAAFEAISMNHVIEHLPDPVGTLRECERLLTPSGRLVVVTPNSSSLGTRLFGRNWVGWDPPRHLSIFSPRSLSWAIESAGLRVLSVQTPAKWARFVWTASSRLRSGRLPDSGVHSVPVNRPAAVLFQLIEHRTATKGFRGEEIVAVAGKA